MSKFPLQRYAPKPPHGDKPKGRVRIITHNGVEYPMPSVTTILDATLAKPELVDWRVNTACEDVILQSRSLYEASGPEKMSGEAWESSLRRRIGDQWKDKRIAAKAANIGTSAHSMIQRHLKAEMGIPLDPLEGEPNDQSFAAFESWLRWRTSLADFRPVKVETVTYSVDHMYSGQYDCLAMHNGRLTMFDWKTSKGLYLSFKIQMAAYCLAERERGTDGIARAVCVRVPKDGSDIGEKDIQELHSLAIDGFSKDFVMLRQLYKMMQDEH